MGSVLLIAIGGAVGAVARYSVSGLVQGLGGAKFPYGTIVVNMLGSFAIGLLYVAVEERHWLGPQWRALLGIGLLGAFTTFSTFSLDTIKLLSSGALFQASVNTMANLVLCMSLTWLAIFTGRQL